MEYQHLEAVKKMIGASGTYQDDAIKGYIAEVIEYMDGAGVSRELAEGDTCIGVVARGVSDLWDLNGGKTSLSPYFKERVAQLAYRKDNADV